MEKSRDTKKKTSRPKKSRDTKKKTNVVSPSSSVKKRVDINKMHKNGLSIFYITLYFQDPNSEMAKSWMVSQGLTERDMKHLYNKIMNSKK
jgi:hypothetical protein